MVRDDSDERKSLMSAFYINELLVRLLPRGEPEPHYSRSITTRSKNWLSKKITLSRSVTLNAIFLKVLGYALPSGPFPAKHYRFVRGDFVANDNTAFEGSGISGTTLESLSTNTLQSGTQEWEARILMRDLIRYYLEDAPLNTRRILNELNKL